MGRIEPKLPSIREIHGVDVAEIGIPSGALYQNANQNDHSQMAPLKWFDGLCVVNEKKLTEALDDFETSMVAVQSDIEQDLKRLKDNICDQDVELKRFSDDLLAHLQCVPRVLPEQCFKKHGDLFKRLQMIEGTLRETACTTLSQIGKQMASI